MQVCMYIHVCICIRIYTYLHICIYIHSYILCTYVFDLPLNLRHSDVLETELACKSLSNFCRESR